MIDCQYIKRKVEEYSGIKDISEPTRKREYIQARSIYYKLCRIYIPNASLSFIGKNIDKCHATVLHGLKIFKELLYIDNMNVTYKDCVDYLNAIQPEDDDKEIDILELKEFYREKHMLLVEESQKEINKYKSKLSKLTKNSFIRRISNLSDNELEELEFKFNNFLLVKEKLNKNRHELKNNNS